MKLTMTALIAALLIAPAAAADDAKPKAKADPTTMRLFKGQAFSGESYVVDRARTTMQMEFAIGSIAIHPGEKWELCDKPRFKGNCNIVDADMTNLGQVAVQSARPIK